MADFIRKYVLDIGLPIPTDLIETIDGIQVVPSAPLLSFTEPSAGTFDNKGFIYKLDDPALADRAIRITDLNIKFDIKKENTASPNTSSITIYNLSDKSVDFLDRIAGLNAIVSLDAGYEGRIEHLLLSNIEDITTVWEGEDRITTIELAEGSEVMRDSLISKSYKAGTPVSTMVEDLINHLNLNRGIVDEINDTIAKPIFMSGRAYDNLMRLGSDFKFDVSIDNLSVNIIDKAKEIPTDGPGFRRITNARIVSPSTGYIGSITKSGKNKGKSKNTDESKNGVEFTVLLDGSITIGSFIELRETDFEGQYKVVEVSHKGEFEGNNWYTKVTAERAYATE